MFNLHQQADMLKLSIAAGEIDLKYLEESGLCVWKDSGYTYDFRR